MRIEEGITELRRLASSRPEVLGGSIKLLNSTETAPPTAICCPQSFKTDAFIDILYNTKDSAPNS